MSLERAATMVIVLIPVLAVWGLLALARRIQSRRERGIARQIALTDAIHRELGAAAAPEVRRTVGGEWIVSIRLPLQREDIVGAVTRLTHDLFRKLDRQDPPRLRVELVPREGRPVAGSMLSGGVLGAGGLRRVA
jgi:hypothetical protein